MNDRPSRPSMGDPSIGLGIPVETQLGNEQGGTMETGYGGAVREDQDGLTADIGQDGATVRKDDDNTETEIDRQAGDGEFTPLPDFDPNNQAVAQQYNATFTTPEGGYNMETLSQDFYANGGEGLSEGTYRWLESRGIDRATAKAIEEGQKALGSTGANAVFTRAGGESNYRGAIEWARQGGYSPQERAVFNAALNAGGAQADMAVDALMARASKGGFRAQRRQSPQRSTSSAGGGAAPAAPAVQPYASYADYQRDLRKAKSENNQAMFDQVRKRGKASKFY